MPDNTFQRALVLILVLLASGCATTRYQVRGVEPEMAKPVGLDDLSKQHILRGVEARSIESYQNPRRPEDPVKVGIIEISERGIVNVLQKEQVFGMVERSLTADPDRGAIIVVFIHGWHHGATVCDSNLMNFRQMLVNSLAANLDRQVIGIYFAWRGESIRRPRLLRPFTYYTRKRTAERIGDTGAVEALFQLEELVDKHRGGCALHTMVTVGHSFGGALLFSAVRRKMIGTDPDGKPFVRSSHDPTGSEVRNAQVRSSFGDLAILLNPAIEANRYLPFDDDLRRQSYPDGQTPVLATFASTSDRAVGAAFPASRVFRLLFHPWWLFSPRGRSNLRAIGHFGPHVTHRLDLGGDGGSDSEEKPKDDPYICEECTCPSLGYYDANRSLAGRRDVRQEAWKEFSTEQKEVRTTTRSFELTPRGHWRRGGQEARFPYMVVRTSGKLIPGHNGIFNPSFVDFLVHFVTSITNEQYGRFLEAKPDCRGKTAY